MKRMVESKGAEAYKIVLANGYAEIEESEFEEEVEPEEEEQQVNNEDDSPDIKLNVKDDKETHEKV